MNELKMTHVLGGGEREMYTNELYHFGVKGMKWGVRRYQNKDGTLTPAGKKRIDKQYKSLSEKVKKDLNKQYDDMYLRSYNKAAETMNNGKIDEFNRQQEKKYGKDFSNREGYMQDYLDLFSKEFRTNMNKSLNDFYESNSNYKKVESLVKKYDMTKYDDLVKSKSDTIQSIDNAIKNEKSLIVTYTADYDD